MGRPPIKKSGAMTALERLHRHRRKLARRKKLDNPKLVAKQERREAHVRMLGEQQTLSGQFGVIVADPPWPWEPYSKETGMDRSPDNHHATMTLEDIKALPVASVAADIAGLWLWATVPLLPEALEVMAAWGFKYTTHYVFCAASRLEGSHGAASRCPFAQVSVSSPCSSFRVPLAFPSEVKGWRLFLIADARAPLPSDHAGRGASLREKGSPQSKSPRTEIKTGRSIRCPARIRRLHQARSG